MQVPSPKTDSFSLLFSGFPTEHTGSTLDAIGFTDPTSAEFDLVFPNIHGSLRVVARIIGSLPNRLVLVIDELDYLLAKLSANDLQARARGARGHLTAEPNPLFGKFLTEPLEAAFSVDSNKFSEPKRNRWFSALGLLLLSRLNPNASTTPSSLDRDCASGIRKCFSNENWKPVLDLYPEPNSGFLDELNRLGHAQDVFQRLAPSQQDFYPNLARLLSEAPLGPFIKRAPTRGFFTRELDLDDEPSINVRITLLPSPEIPEEAEADDFPAALLQLENSSRRAGETDLGERRRLLDAYHRFVRDNQFLPYHWRSMTIEEARQVAQVATDLLGEEGLGSIGLVGWLVLLTGHSPDDLNDFVLLKSFDINSENLPWAACFLETHTGSWWHCGPSLPNAFRPREDQKAHLKEHAGWICLSLPKPLNHYLNTLADTGPRPLHEIFGARNGSAADMLEKFCMIVRERYPMCRAFPARVRAHAFDWCIIHGADDRAAQLAYGLSEYAPLPPLYYYAETVGELNQSHLARLADLGCPTLGRSLNGTPVFGSWLQPKESSNRSLVRNLHNDVEHARAEHSANPSKNSIAAFHNALVIYTLAQLIFATGHRRAKEYCFAPRTLDLFYGFAVIADKIISPANASRLVPLPGVCVEQIRIYIEHLRVLAALIIKHDRKLATNIKSLTAEDPYEAKIPFLGLLSEDWSEWIGIDTAFLENRFGDLWPLPLNAPRDWFASESRDIGLPAEWIHYRMGHIGLGQEPYSETSILIPHEVLGDTAKAINEMMGAQGWSAESGLQIPARSAPLSKDLSFEAPAYCPLPLLRAAATSSMASRTIVKKALERIADAGNAIHTFTASEINQLEDDIKVASEGDVHLAAAGINILSRWLKKKEAVSKSARPPSIALPSIDVPAFSPNIVLELFYARRFRAVLLKYMARNRTEELGTLMAWNTLSLIAFSGIVKREWVIPASVACLQAYWLDQRLWVEFRRHDVNGEVIEFIRRPLDPISTCLTLQIQQRADVTGFVPNPARLERATDKFLSNLVANEGLQDLSGIADCCRLMVPFFRFHLPGVLAGIGDGRSNVFSMAREQFVGVIEDKPFHQDPETEPDDDVSQSNWRPDHKSNASLIQGRDYLKQINALLHEALPAVEVGGNRGANAQLNTKDILKRLDEFSLPDPCPSVIELLRSWVRTLISAPGRRGRRLRANSIRTYWHKVAMTLFEYAAFKDFSKLEEEDLEELYTEVLDARSPKSRAQRARVLRDFHRRCGISLPEMDWHEIEPNIDLDRGQVDANIITPAAYGRALGALDALCKERLDYARPLSCVLILMYRGGLRFGDVFRLMTDEISFSDEIVWIFIQRNRFGAPKTKAGRRIVRLTKPVLRDAEYKLLAEWLQYRRSLCTEAAALCGPSSNPTELYDRRTFETDLLDVLRWATGNPKAKNHHLRHSWLSYHIAAVLPLPKGSTMAAHVTEYFGSDDPLTQVHHSYLNTTYTSRRITHAFRAAIGHASPRSSERYQHLLECSLANHLWLCTPKRIDDIDSTVRIREYASNSPDVRSTWRGSSYDLAAIEPAKMNLNQAAYLTGSC